LTLTTYSLDSDLLPGVEASGLAGLEKSLRDFISSRTLPLYRMMSFQLGWVDENGEPASMPPPARLHGQFSLAIGSALGSEASVVAPYAIGVELLHNFALIHEDVEDGNTERNGRPSVWWTWGPAQAINAGDGMHAMARLALFSLSDRGEPHQKVSDAVRALDQATILLCEGEYLDITLQEQLALSPQKYLEMAASRTGALFGCAAATAAIATGRDGDEPAAFFRFGQATGTARQAALDHSVFWGGEKPDPVQYGRLLAKKKNLPVAHALATASPTIKRKIGDLYVQRVIDPARAGEIRSLLEEAGSREFTEQTVKRLLSEAGETIEALDVSAESRVLLREIAATLAGLHGGAEF
jgi:geranylgeranyl diphosphate synthase type I